LDALVPDLDIDSLKQALITVPVIELQLEWHRKFDPKTVHCPIRL
jgi:hypothetical protein